MNKVTQAAFAVFLGLTTAYFAVSAVKSAIDLLVYSQQVVAIPNLPDYSVKQDFSKKEFVAMIRIETKDTFFSQSQFNCSGAVISNDYVLTAAHCLTNSHGGLTSDKFRMVSLPNAQGEVIEVEGTPATFNRRADYALIKGDFSRFSKQPVQLDLDLKIYSFGNDVLLSCGFPWGGQRGICYPLTARPVMRDFAFTSTGFMYPGMSGGPVIDTATGMIVAVNTGVDNNVVIVSPLVALFDNLGVKVVP